MNNEKSIDALKFKRQLQENAMKRYKGKSSREIMDCINENALKSILHRKNKN